MKKVFLILITLVLVSCAEEQVSTEKAMYFWKTQLQFTDDDKAFIQQNNIHKLYLRYCDIGLTNDIPIPIAPVRIDTTSTRAMTIIPVIYIKNEVFTEISQDNYIAELAKNLSNYIEQINNKYGIHPNEVQLDCDWTLTTQKPYFQFINDLRKEMPHYTFSATIRLHQVKYFTQTGVPPVDYGVLMYYNMGQITPTGNNSIYYRDTAHRYIGNLHQYPLHLNVALPMFSWGVHSVRNKVQSLVTGLTTAEVENMPTLQLTDIPNVYEVKEQTYYKGRLWQAGDRIKIEEVTEKQREEMLQDVTSAMKKQPKEVIFFR